MAHRDNREPRSRKEVEGRDNGTRSWNGPHTVSVHREGGGFGFTLRHFIVYPPESTAQQQGEDQPCDRREGSDGRRSKLSTLDPMDTIFVKQVKDSGPAQVAGLHKGDRIISVNGESIAGKSYSQVIALIQSSQATLKLLVVPKDEDILQMAYETSAYNQGKDPYRGSASDIPRPPAIHQEAQVHRPSRFKSEIRLVPEDLGPGPARPPPFDPRAPRQRHSTSSMGSLSSGSSYSASKDVGNSGGVHGEVAMDTGEGGDVAMGTYLGLVSGEGASSVEIPASASGLGVYSNAAHKSHSSGARALSTTQAPSSGASFTSDLSAAAAAATNPSSLPPGRDSAGMPPAAPHRSSSRNVTYFNVQPGSHDNKDPPYSSPLTVPQDQHHHHSSRENLDQPAEHVEGSSRRSSRSSLQQSSAHLNPHGVVNPPVVEKLLMTSHEPRVRRSSRDSIRHSTDSLMGASSHSGTPERQIPGRLVSTTYLAPGASTTITLTPQSNTTSSVLSPGGQSPYHRGTQPHQWPSDSNVCAMDTSPASDYLSSSSNKRHVYSAKDRVAYNHPDKMSSSEQSLSTLGTNSSMASDDSYGLTVSLHLDASGHKSRQYSDMDSRPPAGSNRDRKQGDQSRINMVSERLKRFESSESVDGTSSQSQPSRRQRVPKRVGYDSVLSRAADFELRTDDDQKRKRSSRTSPYLTPTGSTTSLPQALPPAEILKVPQTPPATINFYFRDGMSPGAPVSSSMANLEPSPEVTLYSPDSFRVRVSSEPPEIRSNIGRERSPLANISIEYGDGSHQTGLRHKGAASRQPSYLTAVSPDQAEYVYPVHKAATLPLHKDQGRGHSHGFYPSPEYEELKDWTTGRPKFGSLDHPATSPRGRLISRFHGPVTGEGVTHSSINLGSPNAGKTHTSVTLRERSRSEDREARLVRRTSYLLATGRQNQGSGPGPAGGRMDVTQLEVPPPAVMPPTGSFSSKPPKPDRLNLLHQVLEVTPELNESPVSPVTPDDRSPSTPVTPTSPRSLSQSDTAMTPTKTSNIKKLKSLFGERTPRILEAITDRKNVFDAHSSLPSGVTQEGALLCKVAVTDGKRASDRSWKQAYAQLRGSALFLFRDKNNVSPTLFDDHPVSIKSSIVDIAYDYTKKKNVFRLTTYNGSEYLCQAEDHESMLQWIRAIQAQNSSEDQKDGLASVDVIVPRVVQHVESSVVIVNRSSPQVAPKTKKTSTRSLRSKSPSSHSPASKPKKHFPDKADYMAEGAASKVKDARTWKNRMAQKFKRYGSSSSTTEGPSEGSGETGITGSFGVPLELVPCSTFNEYVPLVVEVCSRIVEERGLENQGIYRVPGNTGAVNQLQEECNRSADLETLDMESDKWLDVNVVSSLLKSFFRKLPEPLITEDLYQQMIMANRTPHQEKRMLKIKKLLHELPEHNFETFHYMAEHLNRVAEKGDFNKMDGRNLAIVFGPTLIRTSDDNMITMVTDMSDQCRIVESIISNCTWFFSSWSEDVNVPLDQNTDTVPVSGMNQEQLLNKAENLGMSERGRDVSVKDLMSSVIQAANRRIRKTKPKGESVDIDIESEPSSYNERNIDREIELRKGTTSQTVSITTKDTSSLSLEQHTSLPTSLSGCMSVPESKSSLSLDQGRSKDTLGTSNLSLKSSSSSLVVLTQMRADSHLQSEEASKPPKHEPLRATRAPKSPDVAPIKRYPAYPRVDFSSPQIDNSKPMIFKRYASDDPGRGDWRRDNDEVKKTYGLTPQTRQHLRRIEMETQALKRREQEKQRDQAKNAQAKKLIELELQKTRRELEEDNMDELLSRGVGSTEVSSKISDSKQKYSDYINSSMDSRSVTSDYSTMSSTNIPAFGQSSLDKVDYCPVRSSNSVPRELCYSVPKNQDKKTLPASPLRRDSADRTVTKDSRQTSKHKISSCQGVSSSHGRSSHDDLAVPKERGPHRGKTFDDSHKDRSNLTGHGDIGQKAPRKGSLDSLLDIYDHDLSHIDSDVEEGDVPGGGANKEEGLLESIAHAKPQFKLLSTGPGKSSTSAKQTKTTSKPSSTSECKSGEASKSRQPGNLQRQHKSEGLLPERPFRDPTLHKTSAQRDAKVVGIASRFERKDSSDKSLPCYNSESRLHGGLSSGSRGGASSTRQSSKENQVPQATSQRSSASSDRSTAASSASQRNGRGASSQQSKQDSPAISSSGLQSRQQYASALRKSTEKLFGSHENLIDLRSPEKNETAPSLPVTGLPSTEKSMLQLRPKQTAQMRDRKNKRRRYTVGGTGDLEHYEALLLATEQNSKRALASGNQSAYDRLLPKSPQADDVHDIQTWCIQQRLRHADSSPALFDPSSDASLPQPPTEEEPPLKRKGSVKTGEEKAHRAPSRSGSSRSQSTRSSCHSSTPSPSSPGPGTRGITAPFGFVSTV